LRHPNILTVYDFGEQGDYTYIAMEYIEGGRALTHMLEKRGTLDLQTALLVIQQVASALDYAHKRGVIHRDIKPSNILVPRDDWFLLCDFGIAKVAGGGDLTKTGVGVGTPDYMSPEQGRGLPVDERTDVYSLGVMLYRMVVGKLPYQADTPMGVIIKHINEPLPSPRELNPNVPPGVEQIILKAMAKNPEDRFQTAGEMARTLKQAVDGVHLGAAVTVTGVPIAPREVTAPPPDRVAGLPRWVWLAGGGILAVVAIVLCLAVGLGGLAVLGPQDTPTVTQVVQAPTNTPAPTATPQLSTPPVADTPAPTDTPQPAATATDTPMPTEPPAPTDTPVAAPTATPGPTSTPKPTNTPEMPALTGKIAFSVLNPDGRHYDIWVVNADGSNPRRVAEKMRQPCFRPDGVMLAVNGEAPNEAHIITMNADGSNHRPASQHVEDSHPSWSPDGRRLVFDTEAAPGGGWRICIIHNPGARSWDVVPGPAGTGGIRGKYPTWMPDHRIIFNSSNYWAGDTAGGLYAIGDSGGTPARITASGQDTAPAVHGGTVAFMSIRQPGDYEIFTASIYGLDADLKQLTDNSAQDGLPTWSPDGKYIAFVSDEGGAWGLWVMGADGSGRHKLLNLPGTGTLGGDWGTERISWAP
jgi:hypothetical protein